MNEISKFVSYIYGVLLVVGGLMGYLQAHSNISLIMGIVSGALVLFAIKMGSKNPQTGYLFIAAISLILSIFSLMRFKVTQAFFPMGFLLVLSATTFAVVALSFMQKKK